NPHTIVVFNGGGEFYSRTRSHTRAGIILGFFPRPKIGQAPRGAVLCWRSTQAKTEARPWARYCSATSILLASYRSRWRNASKTIQRSQHFRHLTHIPTLFLTVKKSLSDIVVTRRIRYSLCFRSVSACPTRIFPFLI